MQDGQDDGKRDEEPDRAQHARDNRPAHQHVCDLESAILERIYNGKRRVVGLCRQKRAVAFAQTENVLAVAGQHVEEKADV